MAAPRRPRDLPRIWRGFQNESLFPNFKPFEVYLDGDRKTFNFHVDFGPGGNKVGMEFYTIAPGALLPLERFAIQEPPEELLDRGGEPYANYIPEVGELTGSQTEDFMIGRDLAEEARRSPNRDVRYAPLEIELGSVAENFTAPIVIEFPLQYLRFLRWKTRAGKHHLKGTTGAHFDGGIVPKLAYAEFEVFGRGFAAEARYRTQVLDLGEPKTLGRIVWGGTEVAACRCRLGRWPGRKSVEHGGVDRSRRCSGADLFGLAQWHRRRPSLVPDLERPDGTDSNRA